MFFFVFSYPFHEMELQLVGGFTIVRCFSAYGPQNTIIFQRSFEESSNGGTTRRRSTRGVKIEIKEEVDEENADQGRHSLPFVCHRLIESLRLSTGVESVPRFERGRKIEISDLQ